MKKYIINFILVLLTGLGIYLTKGNPLATSIISAFGFSIAGFQMGNAMAEEYYQTPQYVITTEEALKTAAKDIEEN